MEENNLQQPVYSAVPPAQPVADGGKKKGKGALIAVIAVLVILLMTVAGILIYKMFGGNLKAKLTKGLNNLAKELDDARRRIRVNLKESDAFIDPIIKHDTEGYVLPRPLKVGDSVILVNLDMQGTVTATADKDGMVAVQAGVIRTKVKENELMLVDGKQVSVRENPKKPRMASQKSVRAAVARDFRPELDLRGEYTDDAWVKADKYLDDAALTGIKSVTLIHGKGTGALRKAIWDKLKKDPRVKSYRAGAYGEGDYGVTVVDLK